MLYEKSRSDVWSIVFAGICVLLVAFICLNIYCATHFFVVNVSGHSMKETLYSGDAVYADKYASAKRGDVIVIDVGDVSDYDADLIIKRLIAVEGDCVKCENGVVYLKKAGEEAYLPLDEPYISSLTPDFNEIEVGEKKIFFLGDNRANSNDSTENGCLDYSDIVGVVPDWAIGIKSITTAWEKVRQNIEKWLS